MMQNRLITYLKQPYPSQIKRGEMIVITSLLIFFLLAAFQPFGINLISQNKFLILLGYMFVTASCLSVQYYILPAIWKNYYRDSNWTIGKQLFNTLLTILLISFGNSFYAFLIFPSGMNFFTVISYFTATLLISIFPVSLFIILRQNRLLAKNLKAVTEMNKQLNIPRAASSLNKIITVEGSGKETIELDINKFLCAEANGNYVNISYLSDGGKVRKKVLRSTIKQIEEVFNEFPFVVRCHRAFLVNTNAIDQVKGNSQGYRLLLVGIEEEIPVSRAYASQVKNRIDENTSKE